MVTVYHASKNTQRAPPSSAPKNTKTLTLALKHVDELDKIFSDTRLSEELASLKEQAPIFIAESVSPPNVSELFGLFRELQENTMAIERLPPDSPWDGSKATLAFEQLCVSMKLFPRLQVEAAKVSVLLRGVRKEIIHCYINTFHWYNHIGPSLADSLCAQYRKSRGKTLIQEHPKLGCLIVHLHEYLDAVDDNNSKQVKKLKTLPPDLFGLASDTAKVILPSIGKSSGSDTARNAWVSIQFLSIISEHIIVPSLSLNDRGIAPTGHKPSAETVRARAILVGGALSRIPLVWSGNPSILASLAVQEIFLSPSTLFLIPKSDVQRASKDILKDDDTVFASLDSFLAATLVENPRLIALSDELAHLVWKRLTQMESAGGKTPQKKAKKCPKSFFAPKAPSIAKSCDPPISVDTILAKDAKPFYAPAALLVREALSKHDGRITNSNISRIMDCLKPFSGRNTPDSQSQDLDHFHIVRATNQNQSLFNHHIPAPALTTGLGISAALAWVASGLGNQTRTFIESGNGMIHSSADACILAHQTAEQNGIMHYNTRIWGRAPSNWFQDEIDYQTGHLTRQDKYNPMYSSALQTSWLAHIGPLAGQDPRLAQWAGEKKTWSSTTDWIVKQKIVSLKSFNLTVLQLANYLALSGVCLEPTEYEMADALVNLKAGAGEDKGACKGLGLLGFNIKRNKSAQWVRAAFLAFYRHLDTQLSSLHKTFLHFGAIFVEHLLCKISRFDGIFHRDETSKGVDLTSIGQRAIATGKDKFPFALEGSRKTVQEVIDEILAGSL